MTIEMTARRARERVLALPKWLIDAAITVLVGLPVAASTAGGGVSGAVHHVPDPLGYLLLGVVLLPYLFRSRQPFAVFAISSTALVVYAFIGYNVGAMPLISLIGMLTVGWRCSIRQMVASMALIVVGMTVLVLGPSRVLDVGNYLGQIAFFAAALMFGWTIRSRREREIALEERAEALEREQRDAALRAVEHERLRIAQELHDVMAHSMSVIAVQAGAGAHVIESDPVEAKRALANIAMTSRSTLAELRRLLGVLRDENEGVEHAPAPGLVDLDRLVDELRDAGVEVDTHIDDLGAIPSGVDLTAYRIIQEALTNVLKHAGPARATVSVKREGGGLNVEIRDDGRGVASSKGASTESGVGSISGHGLIGMRERVAVFGGKFSAGPATGGGFQVSAHLPCDSEEGGDDN